MRSIAEQLAIYGNTHKNKVTKITHIIGVPLIIFSLLVILGWIHIRVPNFFDMPLSWLLTIFLLVYYFLLDMIIGATLVAVFIVLNLLTTFLSGNVPSWINLQLFAYPFVVGWILLFAGHFIGKEKTTLLKKPRLTLIAPVFVVAEIFFYFGQKKKLKERITELTELKS